MLIKVKTIDLNEWHEWFAWHPVFIESESAYVWLRTIKRRCIGGSPIMGEFFEYKL
jgi:hypothetical protein